MTITTVFEVAGELSDFCDLSPWSSNPPDDGSAEPSYECDCLGASVVVGIANGACITVPRIDGIATGGVTGAEGRMYTANVHDIVTED